MVKTSRQSPSFPSSGAPGGWAPGLASPYEGICFESTCTVSVAGRGDGVIPIGWTVGGENPSLIEMTE